MAGVRLPQAIRTGRPRPVLHRSTCGTYVFLTDWDTAVFLAALRYELVEASRASDEQREFVFLDPDGHADKEVLSFISGQSDVQPITILDAQRWLKKVMHRFNNRRTNRARAPGRRGI